MRITTEELVKSELLYAMRCDVCGATYNDEFEMQEFVSVNATGGYGSIIGDGTHYEVDICQHCFKNMFKKYYRTTELW